MNEQEFERSMQRGWQSEPACRMAFEAQCIEAERKAAQTVLVSHGNGVFEIRKAHP
jgi:hypothetical protein